MVNYNLGKIYKIVDNTNNNIYIGSTCCKYLSERLRGHKGCYTHYLKGKLNYNNAVNDILKNNNYYIDLLETYPCNNKDELIKRERYYIEKYNCVNKRIPGRKHTQESKKLYYQNNKEIIKEKRKLYYNKNKENFKDRTLYLKQYNLYVKSFGGDYRWNNNLLKIDIDIFK